MSSIDPSMILAILPEIGIVCLALIVLAYDLGVGEDRKRALGWLTAGGLAVILARDFFEAVRALGARAPA